MASNDVVGALYYKVVLDPKGFAKGASVIKSEQDLITRALKATTSDYDRLQAELEAVGERAAKAGAVERAVLEKYQKQIISDMEDIIKLEEERAKEAKEAADAVIKAKEDEADAIKEINRLEEERKGIDAMQKSINKIKEKKKLVEGLAELQRKANKEADRNEKVERGGVLGFAKYLKSFAAMKSGLQKLFTSISDVNGGLSKMLGNLAQAAGLSTEMQGLARSLGAFSIPVIAVGVAAIATTKALSFLIKKVDSYQKLIIKMKPLLGGDIERTKMLASQMMDLAAATGFSTDTMNRLAESLLNVGISAMSVKRVGKLLAGLAGGDEERLKFIAKAYGDVMMKGRLMGQEALQFANAGIPIYKALADLLNKSTGEIRTMMEEGNISAEQMAQAMQLLGKDRNIGGQLAENMKTVSGQLARSKVLLDSIILSFTGTDLNEGVALVIKSVNNLLEIIKNGSAFIKEFEKITGVFTAAVQTLISMFPLVGKNIADLIGLLGFLNSETSDPESKMKEDLKAAEERAKAEKEERRKAEERQKAEFALLQKKLEMQQQSQEVRARADYESFVMQQKITEEQQKQLMAQYDRYESLKKEREELRKKIEDETRAAEEKVNREADQARRGMQGAVSGAGPSFGAGSTGEFKFLRDMILNKRQRDAEIKIQKEQKAALDEIAKNTKDQLDKLDELKPGGATTEFEAIGSL